MDRWTEHLNERRAQLYASTRLWNPDPHRPGMLGEKALAEFYGAVPDLRDKPGGDRGVDLEALLRMERGPPRFIEHDAKAARKPNNLLVNVNKIAPYRIYLLAQAYDTYAKLLGWEWGHVMMQCPTKWWCGNDALVHYKPCEELRSLDELRERYLGRWRHHGLRTRFGYVK